MAVAEDKSGNSLTDKPFDSPNRVVVGEPNGTTTPQYAGEIILDTTNNCLWKAVTTNISSWVALTPPN